MAKAIGPAFEQELRAAGIDGNGWSCGKDGSFNFGDLPQDRIDQIIAVYEAHDPDRVPVPDTRTQKLADLKTKLDGAIGDNAIPARLRTVLAALKDTL